MSRWGKLLITQSLLSSWQYVFKSDTSYADFMNTLYRRRKPQSQAMLDGIRFENIVQSVCDGAVIEPDHEWYKPVAEIAHIVQGGQYQVKLSRAITVQNVDFMAYGIFDFLKAGVIYDTKFSKTYRVGKYLDSPQHPMYFYLCPEAQRFEYLISDGKWVYREKYELQDVIPIDILIGQFMNWLDRQNLVSVYYEHWKSKY